MRSRDYKAMARASHESVPSNEFTKDSALVTSCGLLQERAGDTSIPYVTIAPSYLRSFREAKQALDAAGQPALIFQWTAAFPETLTLKNQDAVLARLEALFVMPGDKAISLNLIFKAIEHFEIFKAIYASGKLEIFPANPGSKTALETAGTYITLEFGEPYAMGELKEIIDLIGPSVKQITPGRFL